MRKPQGKALRAPLRVRRHLPHCAAPLPAARESRPPRRSRLKTPFQEQGRPGPARPRPSRAARALRDRGRRSARRALAEHAIPHRRAARRRPASSAWTPGGAAGFPAAAPGWGAAGVRDREHRWVHRGARDTPTVPASSRGRAPGPPGQLGQDPPVEGAEGPRALHPDPGLRPQPGPSPGSPGSLAVTHTTGARAGLPGKCSSLASGARSRAPAWTTSPTMLRERVRRSPAPGSPPRRWPGARRLGGPAGLPVFPGSRGAVLISPCCFPSSGGDLGAGAPFLETSAGE